jgi:Flp pilus assembly protein TadD
MVERVHDSMRRIGPVLVLGVFLGMSGGGCAPPGARAVLQGERLLKQGRVAEAVVRLERAAELMPREARAWNQLGLAYHAAGRPDDAARAYGQAIILNRDLAAARYNMGCLLLEQDQAGHAVNALSTYTGLEPGAVAGWLMLGRAQLRAGQAEAATQSFGRVLQLKGPAAPALNGIGLALVQRRRFVEARQQFARAEQEQPGYAPAVLNSGIVAEQHLRNPKLALEDYRRYLGLANAPHAQLVRERVQRLEPAPAQLASAAETPRPAEAEQKPSPQAPARIPPKDRPAAPSAEVRPATEPGGLEAGAGREQEAPPAAAPVAQTEPVPTPKPVITAEVRTPAEPQPIAEPAAIRETQPAGVEGRSEEPVPEVVAPRVTVPGGYPYAGLIQPAPGDRAEAIRLLNEGIQAQRSFRARKALELYRQAVNADPSLFEAHYNRGVAAFEENELGEALRAYEQALALMPDSLPGRFNFATALERAGFLHDAVNELERLLQMHPDEVRAHLLLGQLYADRMRMPARARPHYQRVLELQPQHPQATALRFWIEANAQDR